MTNHLTLASLVPDVTMAKVVAVCTAVAEGKTVKRACAEQYVTVTALRGACKKEPILQELLDEALKNRDANLADMLVNIDQHVSDPKMASVISKNIQWVLERSDPAKFGQRVTLKTENDSASAQLAIALQEAIKRIPVPVQERLAAESAKLVDARVVEVVDVAAEPVHKGEPATEDQLRALGFL